MSSMKIGTLAFVSALACAFACEAAGTDQYYPDPALKRCDAGRAVVHCTASADGTLRDCHILSEAPAGDGFAEGTLAVTRLWKARPRADGASLEGQPVQKTVVWVPPADCGATWLNHRTMGDFYPPDALRTGLAGRASVECNVSSEGRLKGCKILGETPPGHGFGEAAVQMYETGLRLMVTPEIARGEAVVTRTVDWVPPPAQTPAAP